VLRRVVYQVKVGHVVEPVAGLQALVSHRHYDNICGRLCRFTRERLKMRHKRMEAEQLHSGSVPSSNDARQK